MSHEINQLEIIGQTLLASKGSMFKPPVLNSEFLSYNIPICLFNLTTVRCAHLRNKEREVKAYNLFLTGMKDT